MYDIVDVLIALDCRDALKHAYDFSLLYKWTILRKINMLIVNGLASVGMVKDMSRVLQIYSGMNGDTNGVLSFVKSIRLFVI